MSRSNGNNGHPGPPQRPAPHWVPGSQNRNPQQVEHDPHQLGLGGHPQQGYSQQAPQQQPGYAHPGQQGQPYQQAQAPQGGRPAPQLPQWSPYQPPAPPDLSGYGQAAPQPRAQPGDPHAAPHYHFPPADAHASPANPTLGEAQPRTGHPHAAQGHAPQGTGSGLASYTPRAERQPAAGDGRRYDLAHFGGPARQVQQPQQPGWEEPRHGEVAPYPGGAAGGYQQAYAPPQEQPQWVPPADAYGHPQQLPSGHAQAVDAHGYPLQQGYDQAAHGYGDPNAQYPGQYDTGQYGQAPHDAQPQNQQYEGEYDDGAPYEEEPKKKSRGLLVVAALVSAIVAGGGMAYLYKTFAGGGGSGGKAPILKAEQAPPKSRPATPGGKEFPHAERKITERLGDGQASGDTTATAASEPVESGGPRKVQIIPIAPGGGPQLASGPPPETPARATITVPGMVVDNSQLQPPAQRAAPQQDAAQARQAAVQPPARPQVQPQAPAKAPAQPKVVEQPPEAAAPAKRAAVSVPRPPKANDALTSQGAPTAAAPAASGANGFVAVLSSQKSRMDALKVFADLQQRYGDVLSNKPADVQEANLGERGVFYRAVVGPPGSRESAAQLCSQLKAAGFNGCWVTAY